MTHFSRIRLWLVCAAAAAAIATPLRAQAPATGNAALEAEEAFALGDLFQAQERYAALLASVQPLAPAEREAWIPEVELALFRLDKLLRGTGAYSDLRDVLRSWAETPGTTLAASSVQAHARYMLSTVVLETTASLQKAEKTWAPLGFLQKWHVVGPFDNERGGGFPVAYGPETKLDLAAAYKGKKRQVAWRELPAKPVAGLVPLAAMLDPHEEALAYALTWVNASRARDALLRLGTDEGVKVWVNGQLKASLDLRRTYYFDQTTVSVHLEKGWNSILLKVAQSSDTWRFAARLTDPQGQPLTDVTEGRAPEGASVPRLEGEALSVMDLEPVEALVKERLKQKSTDARSHYLLGALLLHRKAHDENEHPDTEALRQAVQLDESSPAYLLTLASSYRRKAKIEAQKDENQWREAVERAAALGCANADLQLARHYSDTFDNWSKALRLLDRALRANPLLEPAIRLRGKVEQQLDFPRAEDLTREKLWALPHKTLSVYQQQADHLLSVGKVSESRKLYRQVLSGSAVRPSARWRLALIEARDDHVDEALRILRTGQSMDPWSDVWSSRIARLLEGRNRLEEALGETDARIAFCPELPKRHQERARLLLLLGRKDEAIAALARALELQPNLPGVREHLQFLRAKKSTFEDEFRRDVTELIHKALETRGDNPGGDPSRVLLDLTAVEVNRDGTTKEFAQRVFQVLNDLGIRQNGGFYTHYAAGEQFLEFQKARVHHADGTFSDARLSRYGGTASDDVSYSGAGVNLPPLTVGDVIEIEYVREDIKQSFFGDYFGRQEIFQESVPIQEKVLAVRVPPERKLYFHKRNFEISSTHEADEKTGKVTYTWVAKNVPKLDPEPAMPKPQEVGPLLEMSTFKDWNVFSKWYWNLIRKQYEVSPEITRKVRELTSGARTDLDKIRAIYNFVVTDIRYNAWEFGVHGFKPYNASTIFARRFGDCKDKATLLCVMLGEVGVKAWPVLIEADSRRGEEDLSLPLVSHFNHCISYLPPDGARPEMYLDGTAQFHSVEDVPTMDRGARVLVVRDDGGSLQQIPWNSPEQFALQEENNVTIGHGLGANLQVRVRPTGGYAVSIRSRFEIAARRTTQIEKAYGSRFASVKVGDASFSDLADLNKPVSLTVSLEVPRFVQEASEGLVVKPAEDFFQTGRMLSNLGSLEERKQDVIIGCPRRSLLKTVVLLPQGLQVKSLPPAHDISNRFGRLKVTYKKDGDRRILAERLIELTAPRVPVDDYKAFREFVAAVNRLERERILLERS